jgi:hypothetical protein
LVLLRTDSFTIKLTSFFIHLLLWTQQFRFDGRLNPWKHRPGFRMLIAILVCCSPSAMARGRVLLFLLSDICNPKHESLPTHYFRTYVPIQHMESKVKQLYGVCKMSVDFNCGICTHEVPHPWAGGGTDTDMKIHAYNVGFEVLTAVSTKMAVFWVVEEVNFCQTTRRYIPEDSYPHTLIIFRAVAILLFYMLQRSTGTQNCTSLH